MSSSDEPLSWSAFSTRPVAVRSDLVSPVAEMVAVLQRYRADVDAARAAVEDVRREGLKALAGQAVLAVRLEAALAAYQAKMADASLGRAYQHLRILKDQMLEGLVAQELAVVRLLGRPYVEVAALVEVDGWLHRAELEAEVVVEELEPAVVSAGVLIRAGRVVMGAPLQAAPASEEVVGPVPDIREGEETRCPESS
jgi:hypothetical protein